MSKPDPLLDPDAQRCLAAMSGDPNATLDDILCCYQSSSDDGYAAYAEATGVPVVAIGEDELRRIRSGVVKGAYVEAVVARQAAADARTFAEREVREQAEADRLWPSFAAFLGVQP